MRAALAASILLTACGGGTIAGRQAGLEVRNAHITHRCASIDHPHAFTHALSLEAPTGQLVAEHARVGNACLKVKTNRLGPFLQVWLDPPIPCPGAAAAVQPPPTAAWPKHDVVIFYRVDGRALATRVHFEPAVGNGCPPTP